MSVTKVINIKVNDGELNQLEKDLNKVDRSFDKVDSGAKKVDSSIKKVGDNGGAISTLDSVTGGLATRLRDGAEASKLFSFNLKGIKTALIATGIGAFVVALGLVVAYWDDIKDFITGSNVALEEQLRISQELGDEQQRELDLLDKQDNILKLQGKSQFEINQLKKQELNDVIEIRKQELALAMERLQQLEDIKKGGGGALESFFRGANSLLSAFGTAVDGLFAKLGFDTDFGGAASGIGNKVLEGIFGTDEDIQEAKDRIKNLEDTIVGAQNRLAGIQLSERGDGVKRGVVESVVGELSSSQLAELENAKIVADGLIEINDDRANQELAIEQALANAKRGIALNTLALIQILAGEGSAIGKAAAVAQATISGIEGVQNAFTTASKSPITTLFPAYPFIQAGLAGAFSALQIKKILSVDPSGRSTPNLGGSAGGGGSSAPSFNVVGTSGANQIAQSLQQEQNPIQAFVVGSNVTTQQALDRNIIDTATIG